MPASRVRRRSRVRSPSSSPGPAQSHPRLAALVIAVVTIRTGAVRPGRVAVRMSAPSRIAGHGQSLQAIAWHRKLDGASKTSRPTRQRAGITVTGITPSVRGNVRSVRKISRA